MPSENEIIDGIQDLIVAGTFNPSLLYLGCGFKPVIQAAEANHDFTVTPAGRTTTITNNNGGIGFSFSLTRAAGYTAQYNTESGLRFIPTGFDPHSSGVDIDHHFFQLGWGSVVILEREDGPPVRYYPRYLFTAYPLIDTHNQFAHFFGTESITLHDYFTPTGYYQAKTYQVYKLLDESTFYVDKVITYSVQSCSAKIIFPSNTGALPDFIVFGHTDNKVPNPMGTVLDFYYHNSLHFNVHFQALRLISSCFATVEEVKKVDISNSLAATMTGLGVTLVRESHVITNDAPNKKHEAFGLDFTQADRVKIVGSYGCGNPKQNEAQTNLQKIQRFSDYRDGMWAILQKPVQGICYRKYPQEQALFDSFIVSYQTNPDDPGIRADAELIMDTWSDHFRANGDYGHSNINKNAMNLISNSRRSEPNFEDLPADERRDIFFDVIKAFGTEFLGNTPDDVIDAFYNSVISYRAVFEITAIDFTDVYTQLNALAQQNLAADIRDYRPVYGMTYDFTQNAVFQYFKIGNWGNFCKWVARHCCCR